MYTVTLPNLIIEYLHPKLPESRKGSAPKPSGISKNIYIKTVQNYPEPPKFYEVYISKSSGIFPEFNIKIMSDIIEII
jgi:hypothetical protein